MLEGIEVLHQTEIMISPDWFPWVLVIGILFLLIISFAIIFCYTDHFGLSLTSSVLVVFMYICAMFCICAESEPTGRYRYEATIDESVNFTEVYERFDVVDKRGDIYILEDKKEK